MEQHSTICRTIPEGHIDALPDMDEHRYMPALFPAQVAPADHRADMVQAHYDFLTKRQRDSGVRVRLCTTGCYSLYSADGHFIARTTAPTTWCGMSPERIQTAAMQMAYGEDLAAACRAADQDVKQTGAVSEATVRTIRALLTKVDAK